MLCREAFRQFYRLSAKVGSTTSENLNSIILGVGTYFLLLMHHIKKRAMRHKTNKPCSLKVRRYAAHMIDMNDYLSVLPGAKASTNCLRRI